MDITISETHFTIIEIGISISLGIIPGIFFCVGFFCSTFVLEFVSLIFFPDVDKFFSQSKCGFASTPESFQIASKKF
jgi:hypothetical protein